VGVRGARSLPLNPLPPRLKPTFRGFHTLYMACSLGAACANHVPWDTDAESEPGNGAKKVRHEGRVIITDPRAATLCVDYLS